MDKTKQNAALAEMKALHDIANGKVRSGLDSSQVDQSARKVAAVDAGAGGKGKTGSPADRQGDRN